MQVNGDKSVLSVLDEWPDFLQKAALALGGLLLGSAGLCWIAANWDHATALQKLAGTQLVLAFLVWTACHLIARPGADRDGARSMAGQVSPLSSLALSLAAVTTGALLALVGQIYQTGADPWQLFALWLVLMIPWLLARPGVLLALLCVFLLNLSACLYLGIFGAGPLRMGLGDVPAAAPLLMLGLNLMLLLVWERLCSLLSDRWRIGPRALLAAASFWIFAAQIDAIDARGGPWAVAVLGGFLVGLAVYIYTKRAGDLAMVTLAALTAFGLFAVALLTSIESEGTLIAVVLVLMLLAGWTMHLLLRLWRNSSGKTSALASAAASSDDSLPWFISLFRLATMAFVAALLVVFVFFTLDIGADRAWVAGVVFSLAGVGLMRLPSGRMGHEAALVLTTAGIFMTVVGCFTLDELARGPAIALLSAYGLVVYISSRPATLRFLCALVPLSGVLVLAWPSDRYWDVLDSHMELAVALLAYSRLWWLAVAAVLAWTLGQSAKYRAVLPLAWALTCLAQLVAWAAPAPAVFALLQAGTHEPALVLFWLACAALPVLVLAAVLLRTPMLPGSLAMAAPAVLAVASLGWMGAAGVSMALLWLVLARAYRHTALLGFAIVSLLAYLGRFYYVLESTLLQKSLVLALTGGWLLLSWLVWRHVRQDGTVAHAARLKRDRLRQCSGLLVGLALILIVVNAGIYQREQILVHGKSVILALAPVDPRSLMQGDYMALRFQVGDEVRNAVSNEHSPVAQAIRAKRGGYMFLQKDAHGVSHLQGVSPGLELAGATAPTPDQTVLEFRLDGIEPRIVTDAWFFPEGQAKHYESARYGEIRVGDKGTGLLRQLLDENLQSMTPSR